MRYRVEYILHSNGARENKVIEMDVSSKGSAAIIVRQKNYKFDNKGKLIRRAEILNITKL